LDKENNDVTLNFVSHPRLDYEGLKTEKFNSVALFIIIIIISNELD